jgi:hypothetical protein
MHGTVTSYNQGTGVLVVDINGKTGSGTYSSWEINLDGAVGIQGYTGSQGGTGGTGYTGSQGNQGDTGFVGSRGDIGYVGSKGDQGNQGNVGYVGSKGDIGYVGSKGDIGYIGSKGDQGNQGNVGYVGSKGDIGYVGSQGPGANQSLNTTNTVTFASVLVGSVVQSTYYVTGVSGSTTIDLMSFDPATISSVKYLVQIVDNTGSGLNSHVQEILVSSVNGDVYETEFGITYSASSLGDFNNIYSSGNIVLQVTPTSLTNATVRVFSVGLPK